MKSGTFTKYTLFTVTAAQVSVPTGERTLYGLVKFTVPQQVHVLKVTAPYSDLVSFVGVTPGKEYTLDGGCTYTRPDEEIYYDDVYVENAKTHKPWIGVLNDGYHDGMESDKYILSWSPEINTHTPDVTDY